jgi:tetratricopeptide (TPR) repeat protein
MEADDTLASYVLSARFVGREREAAALVERVSAPSGPLVVIGEAGTGKSRLLREVRQRLQLAAIPWIAIDLQRADDEQALLVALAAGVLGPEVIAALEDEERLELARVLPELQRKSERILTAIDPERSRAARLAAMGRAIALRFGRNAGVLAIDDLHFAGAETAAALTAILSAARAHGATCLFVVTARPCEQARDLERDLGASRVDLITLSPELALRLCESMFGDAALLADTSLGRAIAEEPRSALWVQESLRLAIDAGAIVRAAGRWRVLADVAARPLGEVLAARLAEIPAAARELALASAVLAHPATPADLAAVSGRPLGDAAIALGDLRRAGIVEDRSDAQGHVTYAMHDRYVEAALATSEARPRAAMHRNVARWLARRGRWWDLAAAAQHWLDAGDAARAARTFRLAAARCDRSGRPDRALELCTAELALLERAAERAPAWLTLHDLACKAGRPERAEASLLELERIAPRLDPAKRVEITLRRARSTFRTGDAAAAQRLCRRALGRSRALDRGDLECELLLLSAEIESTFGRARVALQRYREAAELAGERDDAARGATAWLGVALAEIHAGRYPEALAASSRAIRAARALGDRGLLSEALRHHGSAQRDGGNSTAAARSYRRAIEAARQCGGQELEAKALNNLGTVAQSLGRPAQAIEAYGRSIALKLRAGAATSALVTQNNLGSLLAATGRLDEARVAFENALALAGGATPQIVHLMQCNLGDVHLAEGHLDEALALFRAAFVAYEARAQDDYGLYAVTGLVRALAMRAAPGDLEEASAFEPRFEALSRTFPMPERLRRLHVTAALLADARGDLELAHRAARRAAEQTDARADFSGVFGTFVEARWLAALLHARAGSAAKAARTAAAARRSLERIARRLGDDATRTAFLGGHPVHRAILGGELDTPAGWLWKPLQRSSTLRGTRRA